MLLQGLEHEPASIQEWVRKLGEVPQHRGPLSPRRVAHTTRGSACRGATCEMANCHHKVVACNGDIALRNTIEDDVRGEIAQG